MSMTSMHALFSRQVQWSFRSERRESKRGRPSHLLERVFTPSPILSKRQGARNCASTSGPFFLVGEKREHFSGWKPRLSRFVSTRQPQRSPSEASRCARNETAERVSKSNARPEEVLNRSALKTSLTLSD
jgi:hypothetical protein